MITITHKSGFIKVTNGTQNVIVNVTRFHYFAAFYSAPATSPTNKTWYLGGYTSNGSADNNDDLTRIAFMTAANEAEANAAVAQIYAVIP